MSAETNTAVALTYERGSAQPPTVVAVGHGEVARRIVEIAFANGVPVQNDAELAGLLARVDPGSEIPTEAMFAVAKILAFLYRQKRIS